MATIESLSSAKTYQAQATEKSKPAAPANTDVPEGGQTGSADAVTVPVVKSQPEGEKGNSDGTGAEGQQQKQSAEAKQAGSRPVQQKSEQLKKAIAEMNKKINNSNEEAVFGVHEDTNRIMIKIMDKDTKEVIKEFPPEKTLDMIAKIWEMAGILVDEKL